MKHAVAILRLLAAGFLVVNFADFVTTWIAVSSGKGVEANPLIVLFGGALSPGYIVLKLLVIPGVVLCAAWCLARKLKDASAGIIALVLPVVTLGVVVASNVLVVAKKARKIIRKKEEKKWRKVEGKERKTRS